MTCGHVFGCAAELTDMRLGMVEAVEKGRREGRDRERRERKKRVYKEDKVESERVKAKRREVRAHGEREKERQGQEHLLRVKSR